MPDRVIVLISAQPPHEPRGERGTWKDRAAKWGPLVLSIGRFVQDTADRFLG